MSYNSLLKNIPEFLSQPTGIAVITSIGIHGAIALIVPLMPVSPSKPPETASSKSVGILELSQADQNRLPQTQGTTQFAAQPQLPGFPQQPQLSLAPQVPPISDPQTTVTPPLTPSPSSYPGIATSNSYPVSSFPKTSVIAKGSVQFNNGISKFDSQKLISPGSNFAGRRVVPETSQPLPNLSSGIISPEFTPQTTEPQTNGLATQNQTPETGIVPTPKTEENTTPSKASIPTLQPVPTPNQKLIAQLQSYEEVRKALQQQYPNSEEKPVIRDTVFVSKAGVEGTILGFLVVDPDGKVLDIKFQDKLRSPKLELKARQYFNNKSLKGDKQISRYPFRLTFQDSSKTAGTTTQTPSITTETLSKPTKDSQQLIIPARNNQPTSTPAETTKPSSTPTTNSNQLSSSEKQERQLIEKLRAVKKQRANSDKEN